MKTILYYIPPTEEIFEEVKEKCKELWKEIDTDNDKYGYTTEKINRIKDIKNIQDNFMFMVAMFDNENVKKLSKMLSEESKAAIRDRLNSVENFYLSIFF